jgi:hypothetical protein
MASRHEIEEPDTTGPPSWPMANAAVIGPAAPWVAGRPRAGLLHADHRHHHEGAADQ